MASQKEIHKKYTDAIRTVQKAQEENHFSRKQLETQREDFEAGIAQSYDWAVRFESAAAGVIQGQALADETFWMVSYAAEKQNAVFDDALAENAKQRDDLYRQEEELIDQMKSELNQVEESDEV